MGLPIQPLFDKVAYPEARTAILFKDLAVDYPTLSTACAAFRRVLAEGGLAPGDRIAVWTHPDLNALLALVGGVVAGVATIPLNPALGDQELMHILTDAKPDAILSSRPESDRIRTPTVSVLPIAMKSGSMVTPRSGPSVEPDDPQVVLYTSGTTGAPKGAMLTPRNIATNLDALASAWGLTEEDTIVHALPLFHVHGLILGLFGALRLGACLHWLPKFEPAEIAKVVGDAHGVLFAVPTMYHRLADAAELDPTIADNLKRARLLISGSAPLSVREHERIFALTGQRVIERYGLTETLINTSTRADGERRAGYVGSALDGIEVGLVDDARKPLTKPDNTSIGEVRVRGPNVFKGYLNRPDSTAAVLDGDGWFYTGDLGTLSEDGMLRIVGRRATDLIKTGGFKVGAGEIESALLEHAQVREAAVVGAPDEDLGERIVAFVVAGNPSAPPSAEELIEHVGRLLSKHKRPRLVRFVRELPRNAMGKVQKRSLLDLL